MSEQFVDRKRLFELFKQVAEEAYRLQRGRTIDGNTHDYGYISGTTHEECVYQMIGAPKSRNGIFMSPYPGVKFNKEEEDCDNNQIAIAMLSEEKTLTKLSIIDNDGYLEPEILAKYDIETIYYDFEKDAELTQEKAAELIDIFALAISQISPMDMDRVYGLMEGPEVDDEKARRTRYPKRAEAIAQALVIEEPA